MQLASNDYKYLTRLLLTIGLSLFMTGHVVAEGKSLSQFEPQLGDKFKTLLRDATPDQGEIIFMRKCSSCHDHEKSGGHGKGPHLWNLMGRKAGSSPGFDYSDAMKQSGHSWNFATLNYYLTNTEQAVPGRIMEFRGIRRDKVRARLLAFLRSFNDNIPPLP
ncbi:MAG: c-type cytochrome [Gammaproteobacteria bacterium]|nr:c-type cytochrome [Gammaproteobacteria bacterium]